jgi:hypothetical protein
MPDLVMNDTVGLTVVAMLFALGVAVWFGIRYVGMKIGEYLKARRLRREKESAK